MTRDLHSETDQKLRDARNRARERPLTPESAEQWRKDRREIYMQAPERYDVCACTGPRRDEPLCPCDMRATLERDGRTYLLNPGPDSAFFEDSGPASRWTLGMRQIQCGSAESFSLKTGETSNRVFMAWYGRKDWPSHARWEFYS